MGTTSFNHSGPLVLASRPAACLYPPCIIPSKRLTAMKASEASRNGESETDSLWRGRCRYRRHRQIRPWPNQRLISVASSLPGLPPVAGSQTWTPSRRWRTGRGQPPVACSRWTCRSSASTSTDKFGRPVYAQPTSCSWADRGLVPTPAARHPRKRLRRWWCRFPGGDHDAYCRPTFAENVMASSGRKDTSALPASGVNPSCGGVHGGQEVALRHAAPGSPGG